MKDFAKSTIFMIGASFCLTCKFTNARKLGLRGDIEVDSVTPPTYNAFVENSSARDLTSLNDMRTQLLKLENGMRNRRKMSNLKLSKLGHEIAQKIVVELSQDKNHKKVSKANPIYSNYCHGNPSSFKARDKSIKAIFDSWWKKSSSKKILLRDNLFSGIGISKVGQVIYIVQIFCDYNFIDKVTIASGIERVVRIRKQILQQERKLSVEKGFAPKKNSKYLTKIAQESAVYSARNGKKEHHTNYKDVCSGSGRDLVAVDTTTQGAVSSWGGDLIQLLSKENIAYTGVGIAERNDGAIFVTQLFCSLEDGKPPEPTQRDITRKQIFSSVNEYRVQNSLVPFIFSPVTTEFAQNWALHLGTSNSITKDPNYKRGCSDKAYQTISKADSVRETITDIFVEHGSLLAYKKIYYVGIGITSTDEGLVVVLNFCAWKPYPENV